MGPMAGMRLANALVVVFLAFLFCVQLIYVDHQLVLQIVLNCLLVMSTLYLQRQRTVSKLKMKSLSSCQMITILVMEQTTKSLFVK